MSHILKDNYFVMLENHLQAINPGCDMLVINLKNPIKKLDKLLHILDSDNSEISSFQSSLMDFTINKNETGEFIIGDISISVDDTPYKIMQYRVQKSKAKQELFKMYGQLTFYSTLFRIIELGHIPYTNIQEIIEDVFSEESSHILGSTISRYDYKIDFIYSEKRQFPSRKDVISDVYKRKNEEFYRLFGKGEESTGWQVGSKSNKSYLIRFYDKNVDTKVKNKRHLYGEYLTYPSVLRLEGEFHTKFMRDSSSVNYTLRTIEKLEFKARLFFLLEDNQQVQKFLTQYRKKNIDLQNIIRNLPYVKTTCSRLLKIAQGGVNPFIVFVKHTEIKSVQNKLPQWAKELDHYIRNVLFPNQKLDE